MLTYWFQTTVASWVPLVFAIGFALIGVVAVFATLARRAEERDARFIASLYGVGLGVMAVSELMMYLDLAFGWSLAATWVLSLEVVGFVAIVAAAVAVLAVVGAALLQVSEERSYRQLHPAR
jgi:hypothetical protein